MSFDKAIYQLCLERKRKQACYANDAKNNKKNALPMYGLKLQPSSIPNSRKGI
jgi:hypothetical protein